MGTFLTILIGGTVLTAYVMIERRINQRVCPECGFRVSIDTPEEDCPRCGSPILRRGED